MFSAYHRAKFSAIKIIGEKIVGNGGMGASNLTNMTTVSQSIPSNHFCTSCVGGKSEHDNNGENVSTSKNDKLNISSTSNHLP